MRTVVPTPHCVWLHHNVPHFTRLCLTVLDSTSLHSHWASADCCGWELSHSTRGAAWIKAALHCSVLLDCAALHCIVVRYPGLYCTAIYCSTLAWTALSLNTLHCMKFYGTLGNTLACTVFCYNTLNCSVLCCAPLQCTVAHFTTMHYYFFWSLKLYFCDFAGQSLHCSIILQGKVCIAP